MQEQRILRSEYIQKQMHRVRSAPASRTYREGLSDRYELALGLVAPIGEEITVEFATGPGNLRQLVVLLEARRAERLPLGLLLSKPFVLEPRIKIRVHKTLSESGWIEYEPCPSQRRSVLKLFAVARPPDAGVRVGVRFSL